MGFVEGVQRNSNTYRAAGNLVRFAVVVFVVGSMAVAVHSHDIGEHSAGAVVLVRIEEDTQALEFVRGTEHISLCRALLREPHCEAVSVEISLSMYFELDNYL